MKKSEYISCFLDFMRESTMEYEVARSRQSDADNETQDLLHRLELHDDTYHDMARISRNEEESARNEEKQRILSLKLEPVCKWREEKQGREVAGAASGRCQESREGNTEPHLYGQDRCGEKGGKE